MHLKDEVNDMMEEKNKHNLLKNKNSISTYNDISCATFLATMSI